MFKLFGKKKMTVYFHMKSGKTLSIVCENITIDRTGNDLVGYTIDGIDKRQGNPVFYIHLDSIESISTKQ